MSVSRYLVVILCIVVASKLGYDVRTKLNQLQERVAKLETRLANIEGKTKSGIGFAGIEAPFAEIEKSYPFALATENMIRRHGLSAYGTSHLPNPGFEVWGGGIINGRPWYIVPLEAKEADGKTVPPTAEPKPAASSTIPKSPTFTPPLSGR